MAPLAREVIHSLTHSCPQEPCSLQDMGHRASGQLSQIRGFCLARCPVSPPFLPLGAPLSRMTASSTSLRPTIPIAGRRSSLSISDTVPRQQLLDQASRLFARASQAAEDGDVQGSARLILEALDCERRAGGVGPQVLQLIKPRH